MSHHGRAGKNAIPSANAGKSGPDTVPAKAARGRTAKTTSPDRTAGPVAREGNVKQERFTEVNKAIGAGVKKRGDRQNMTPDPGIRGNKARIGKRQAGVNKGLRNDRNPQSATGRQRNRVPNEGG